MPKAPDLNPPASSAAAPGGLSPSSGPHFPMGADKSKEGETMIQKKEEHDGSKYATATTEAEFHEALNRGYAVELTRELAEEIGVPMNEDVGTVAEIDQARYDRHD